MPTARFASLDPAKRQRLFEVALETFAQHGYHRASMNRILERAGMSKGAFYYYFENKEDLFVTVIRELVRELGEAVGGLAKGKLEGNFWDSFRDLVVRSLHYIETRPVWSQIGRAWYELIRSGRQGSAVKQFEEDMRRFTARILRLGQYHGDIRADLPLSLLVEVTVGVAIAVDSWAVEQMDLLVESPTEWVDRIVDLFQRLLRPETGETS